MSKFDYLNGATIVARAKSTILMGPTDTRLDWVRSIITDMGEFRVHAQGWVERRTHLVCPAEMAPLKKGDDIIPQSAPGSVRIVHIGAITSDPNERNELSIMIGPEL